MARRDIYKDGVATRFKPQGEIPPGARIAKRPLTVKVLEEFDTVIRALPEPSAWLRKVICEAARKELLDQSQGGTGTGNQEPSPSPENSHFFSKPGTAGASPRRRLRIRVRR